MNYVELGKSGVKVSEIVLGCWAIGGDYFGAKEDARSIACIQASFEMGVNSFDTAELYGRGHSEEVMGKALKGIDRSRYVLIDKAWTSHFDKKGMAKALADSMRRLRTDYLDVYFLHYPPVEQSIGEAMENILALKKSGVIKAVGVSNFSLSQMEEALRYGEIDVIQPCYSLLWRYDDRDVLPFCREKGIGVIPYSTLAQGLLTGALNKDTVFTDGRKNAALFQPGVYEQCLEVTSFVSSIAEKYGKTTAQTVINWLIHTPGISAPIVGGSSIRHAEENAGATGWRLSDGDYAAIDARSREFTDKMPEYELFFNTNIK